MHHSSSFTPQLSYTGLCYNSEASTRLDTWPGTCPAYEDAFQKGAKSNGVLILKRQTNVLLSSWIYAGATKQEMQCECPARAHGLRHKGTAWEQLQGDLPWTSSQKHLLQLNNWRGGRVLFPALLSVPYFTLLLHLFLGGISPRVLNCMTQEFGTAQSYRSASGSSIQKKICGWIHVLQTTKQLRKHQPAIFGCCTNFRKVLHELDTFGISPLLALPITNPFMDAFETEPDFRVRSFQCKLYM